MSAIVSYAVWFLAICQGLGSDDFGTRQRASDRLERVGSLALPGRVVGTLAHPDCEVRSRLLRGTAGQLADWLLALWVVAGPTAEDASPGVLIRVTALATWLGVQDSDWTSGQKREGYFIGLMVGRARTRLWQPGRWGELNWYPYGSAGD